MLAAMKGFPHRCIDDSKRRHGSDEEAGDAITSTPISKRKRTTDDNDDVTISTPSDSKTSPPPPQEDKSDVEKSANMSPSTSSTSSSFDEGNATDISQTSGSSSVSVSPFRHSSNEDEDKMRAGSPDSGIEATASPYSATSDPTLSDPTFMMYTLARAALQKRKERLSSSSNSQEVMSNADSCVPLDSTPTSPENNCTSADSNKESIVTSDSEQQGSKSASSVDSPVAAYRLCLERPPEPPKPKPAEPSVVCYWDGCEEIFFEGSQLQDHLQEEHVKSANEESKYACRWRGCRVYDKPTRNSSCLHQHVVSHSGCKRFPCCFEGCSARFQTSAGLERHVSSHLKKVKSAGHRSKSSNHSSSYGGGRQNNGGGGPLGVRRRYKDQMMPLANRYDCMDAYTMEKIGYRLRLLKRFEEKRSTRRRHIPPTTATTSSPSSSSMTSHSPITSTLDCSASSSSSSVAATSLSTTLSSSEGTSSVQDEQVSGGGEASAICELFSTPSTPPPSRTELEDILFFNRPQKRRRKNKREVYGPQLFGGPNY